MEWNKIDGLILSMAEGDIIMTSHGGGVGIIIGIAMIVAFAFVLNYFYSHPMPYSSTDGVKSDNTPTQLQTTVPNITDVTASAESQNQYGYLILGTFVVVIVALIAIVVGWHFYNKDLSGRQ